MASARVPRRAATGAALLCVALVAAGAAASASGRFSPLRAQPAPMASRDARQPAAPPAALLPTPVPQPIMRTAPGAQVAWLWVPAAGQQSSALGVDPGGRVVRLDTAALETAVSQFWRSADGATLLAAGADSLIAFSALDGTVLRSDARTPGRVVGEAFSPDGHWLALLVHEIDPQPALQLEVIDLHTGASQMAPVIHDASARLPGMRAPPNTVVWGLAVFAPDAQRVFTLTDWGGPARLTAFSLASGHLSELGSAVDGQSDQTWPSCAGPAVAAQVVGGGQTLVVFCHVDGVVWFFDLSTLRSAGIVRSRQPNPFWLSPLFTPDGQLLYLHQWPAFGDTMQVVDLASRRLFGPVPIPTQLDRPGPLARLRASLVRTAYAGGVASTVPLSPDGLKLYAATGDGVLVLRVPDLQPLARLAPGFKANEAWVSGNGQTIYATAQEGDQLLLVRDDGSEQRMVMLPSHAGGFIASEHG